MGFILEIIYPIKHSDIGTHWIALYVNAKTITIYFDNFGVEHIPKKSKYLSIIKA